MYIIQNDFIKILKYIYKYKYSVKNDSYVIKKGQDNGNDEKINGDCSNCYNWCTYFCWGQKIYEQ